MFRAPFGWPTTVTDTRVALASGVTMRASVFLFSWQVQPPVHVTVAGLAVTDMGTTSSLQPRPTSAVTPSGQLSSLAHLPGGPPRVRTVVPAQLRRRGLGHVRDGDPGGRRSRRHDHPTSALVH